MAAQRQQPSRLGRDSGLGRASFARSMLAASEGAAAASVAAVAGAETEEALPVVSWQEAAAMPHDKLLQLLRALQLDVKALQTELEGGWGVVFLVARGTWHFAALHAVQLGSLKHTAH